MFPRVSCRGVGHGGCQGLAPPLLSHTPNIHQTRTQVRAGLVPLIADLKARGTPPDNAWLAGDYDVKKQAALCEEVALDMGECD